MARDRFLANWLLENGKYDGFYVDSEYITIETALALTVVANTDENEQKCTVIQPILSTPLNDYGIVRVRVQLVASPYTHTTCNKVDRRGLSDLKLMEFSAPDSSHPVVYRAGQVLYFSAIATDTTAWVTSTVYAVGEFVVEASVRYKCLTAHTSGTFSTDLAAAKWEIVHTATIEYVESMVGSDKDYSISGAHVEQVTEMAEEIGKRELGIMIVDPVNDGDQNNPQPQTR